MGQVRIRQNKKPAQTLRMVRKRMEQLGYEASLIAAKISAPSVTSEAQSMWDSGRNVYGRPRHRGVRGNELTLRETGNTRSFLSFVVVGPIMRAALSTPYARYLIGRYEVLPIGDRSSIPPKWVAIIDAAVQTAVGKTAKKVA